MKKVKVLNHITSGLLLIIAVLISSCTNTHKLIERGNYEEAVSLAVRKLAGKNKKKSKYVQALEEAFAKATARDMARIKHLRAGVHDDPSQWEKIHALAQDIEQRQQLIAPLLPVIDREGYKAHFEFVKTEVILAESRKAAAAYLYAEARAILNDVEGNYLDKKAAREAFDKLDRIDRYYPNYKDRFQLMEKAKALGTSHVQFAMINNAPVVLPYEFEEEITRINLRELEGSWTLYHAKEKPGLEFDYRVVMNLRHIEVSPAQEKERQYIDSKEIIDGIEYLYDKDNKPIVDSSGTHISIPKKVLIQANVVEVLQHKAAHLSGYLEIYNVKTDQLIRSEPISVDAVFENYASTFFGNPKALSQESRRRIGNQPRPFPSDASLLLQAANELKPLIAAKLRYTNRIL